MQVLAAPFAGVARAHFQGVQRGELIAVGDVALALAMLVASAVCVAADLGFAAIAAATASGYVAQALVMTALLPRGIRLAWGMRWAVWRDMLRISLPLGATLIINYLYFRLDVLLLAILRDTDAVAIYGLAYRVLEGLMVFPMYFMLALFPEIARLSADRARVDAIVVAALGGDGGDRAAARGARHRVRGRHRHGDRRRGLRRRGVGAPDPDARPRPLLRERRLRQRAARARAGRTRSSAGRS